MSNAEQFYPLAVLVPASVLETLDRRLVNGESRSDFVLRLLERALAMEDEADRVARYVAEYRERPQTEEEFGWSDQVAAEHLGGMP